MQEFDKEVGVSFTSGKLRSRSCICLIILSVAVVVLLAVSAIFMTLHLEKRSSAQQSTARPSNTPYLPITQKPGEQKYCGSKACLLASLGRLPF